MKKTQNDLVLVPLSTFAIKQGENGKIKAPSSFPVLACGTIRTRDYGPFLADDEAFNLIIADFADISNDMVIDYEHSTLSGNQAPAAGWIKNLVKAGCDLWAVVEWTDKAKAYIAAKEYRYFSPVVLKRKSDNRAVAIHSVALTNSPNIKGLEPLVNKTGAKTSTFGLKSIDQGAQLSQRITVLEQKLAGRSVFGGTPLKNLPDSGIADSSCLTPEMRRIGALFGNSDEDIRANL
ncbi:hypothetical protein KAR91_08455 [Candidatus Pacearchaeota archaeon]|nr:hypothetical protein [Candidatus Pacearchaeota archaeon]